MLTELGEKADSDDVILFGGAARLSLLVRRLEQLTGVPVRVGSAEAAALGNAIVQGVAIDAFGSLAEGQTRIAISA